MRTDCVQGKQLLRHWMQTPSWDLEEIERRQHAIHLFLDPDTRQELNGVLKHVRCPVARQCDRTAAPEPWYTCLQPNRTCPTKQSSPSLTV
jgi:DNA mismatch repair ATPase MutS